MKTWIALIAGVLVVYAIGTSGADPQPATEAEPAAEPVVADPVVDEPEPTEETSTLLFVTDLKDGDSFDASDGHEYRLGMVNAPETGQPCSRDAADFTRDFLADGFVASTYSSDRYGRRVAEILDADGASLNVALARSGLGDDRYLAEFRHENPELATRLVDAFAAAPNRGCGGTAAQPAPLVNAPDTGEGDCHPNYSPCLPRVHDLDCGEIGHSVRVTGGDPYRLDRDGDGTGCD